MSNKDIFFSLLKNNFEAEPAFLFLEKWEDSNS